ncbi:WD repeat-containing protein 18 [Chrysoperla carnea]|uniref:WD repeat-containing protein 18 n=1 Tax=Chrysoperla carnea TaxID=189513 RepID=UPI001D096E35|nr:WD repeat-containing protein 18 [Chrysoperla carnea]XP_044734223.1 WD repeat-containing protein 18 [Chrysoperla carnea]
MDDLFEVIFTSDSSGQLCSTCVWNPITGNVLHYYKGGGSATPKTVGLIRSDYMVAADSQKPLLHIWPLNSQEQVSHMRFVMPNKVNVLAISPDGNYCLAAISEHIYIWQISTGNLLAMISRHYQDINCLKFVDSGSHFISGGEDGMLIIWSLENVVSVKNGISQRDAGKTDPICVFTDHSLPITDIYIGHGGIHCRFVSVSLDRTCKIYDFATQTLLLSVVFDVKLTAVTMNSLETTIFTGDEAGNIYEFCMLNPPRTAEYYVNKESKNVIYKEHTKKVNCLSVSLDNQTLLSGSDDEQVLLWHIPSKSVIRTIPHKGCVTNAFFSIATKNLFVEEFHPSIVLQTFKRNFVEAGQGKEDGNVIQILNVDKDYITDLNSECFKTICDDTNNQFTKEECLQQEVDKLKKLNKELYQFALNNIVEQHVLLTTDANVLTPGKFVRKRKLVNNKQK